MKLRKIGEAILIVGLSIACISAVVYVIAGLWLTVAAASNIIREPTILAIAVAGIFVGIMLMLLGHGLDRYGLMRLKRGHGVIGRELRINPRPLPPGYNKSVLYWFYNGPELRKRDKDFNEAFDARAKMPPAKPLNRK